MKKLLALILIVVLTMTVFAACAKDEPAPVATPTPEVVTPVETPEPTVEPEPPAEPVELFISAAASLTDVMQAIAEQYKSIAPNVNITFTFDSSGTLQQQIEQGAPSDIFISAAQRQMNALADQNLINAATRLDLLINKVVLIVPGSSDLELASFEDVTTDKVSMVAIGGESVPVGQYTQEIYEFLGTWDQVMAKANLGENVRAVLAWVESGDVDCGIVYATDAASTPNVKIVAEAPEGSHAPVIYPAAVLAESQQQEAAAAFLAYLATPDAVAAFQNAGFTMA